MKAIITIGVIGFIALVVSFSGCSVVDTGEAGMKVTWGEVTSSEPLAEGIYFYNPITTSVVTYDVRNKVYTLKTDLYTKDNQPVTFSVSVTYHLNRDKVIPLHKFTGKDYENKLFVKNVNGCLKNIVGQIATDDIVTHRTAITEELKRDVSAILAEYGIEVVFAAIDDVEYDNAYEAAIREKQVALQKSQKEKNETARISETAKQEVIKAEAQAKVKLTMAEAEAKAALVKAEADAKAIDMKNKALAESKKLVEYTLACQWDGKLPITSLGGGANPLVLLNGNGGTK